MKAKMEGWGATIIRRLTRDIRNEMPEVKWFSERNISYMIRFACEYGAPLILQQPVAKLDDTKILPRPVAKSASHAILPLDPESWAIL